MDHLRDSPSASIETINLWSLKEYSLLDCSDKAMKASRIQAFNEAYLLISDETEAVRSSEKQIGGRHQSKFGELNGYRTSSQSVDYSVGHRVSLAFRCGAAGRA